MIDIFRRTLLFDFYGELLTDHQKEIYEEYIADDLSLGEVAKERGISRQGVHDIIRRCDNALEGYESKLGLVERFLDAKKKIDEICTLTNERAELSRKEILNIHSLAGEILDEL